MTPKELGPAMNLSRPQISKKTPIDQLITWSSQRWPSSATEVVARDIVNNAAELIMARDKGIDFEFVLRNIKVDRHGSGVYFGRSAIAVNSARTIGGIAVALGLPMHDPPLVVVSGIYFSESVKNNSSLNDFRKIMIEVTEDYARDTLPSPDLYMKILRSLFIEKTQNTKRRTGQLLQRGNIEEVYNMINPRGAFVMSRTRQFPKATTSSILTPPNPSI